MHKRKDRKAAQRAAHNNFADNRAAQALQTQPLAVIKAAVEADPSLAPRILREEKRADAPRATVTKALAA